MLRELFRIPGLDWPVYGYGLMLVLGVWVGVEVGRRLFQRLGLDGDLFVTLGVLGLVSGIVGARISHVLENLSVYTDPARSVWQNLTAAIDISSGGLTFYGGFLFATAVLLVYGRRKGLPVRLACDVVAPCLMIGLAFGRVGCFMNGCCWGETCTPAQVPWAMTFPYASPAFEEHLRDGLLEVGRDVPRELVEVVPTRRGPVYVALPEAQIAADPRLGALASHARSLPVHPTQLYSALNAALIVCATLAYLRLGPRPGRVFALMMILKGPSRFAIETLRVNPEVAMGLTFSMWVSLFVGTAGVVLWVVLGYLPPGRRPPVPQPV